MMAASPYLPICLARKKNEKFCLKNIESKQPLFLRLNNSLDITDFYRRKYLDILILAELIVWII